MKFQELRKVSQRGHLLQAEFFPLPDCFSVGMRKQETGHCLLDQHGCCLLQFGSSPVQICPVFELSGCFAWKWAFRLVAFIFFSICDPALHFLLILRVWHYRFKLMVDMSEINPSPFTWNIQCSSLSGSFFHQQDIHLQMPTTMLGCIFMLFAFSFNF